ncbi:hypothetical protein JYQ62_14295 [Nostoc sp. UHCC 0702]|nr:hypothetical protein JYQ62_14295 [Nostoc sp. UHCC 0702]
MLGRLWNLGIAQIDYYSSLLLIADQDLRNWHRYFWRSQSRVKSQAFLDY